MIDKASAWLRLPLELRERKQWLLAGPDAKGDLKRPTTFDAQGTLVDGSSTNRDTWLTFDQAHAAAMYYGLNLGYCCAPDDPYAVIDLDVKNSHNAPDNPELWTTDEQIQTFSQIIEVFASYTERSQSRQGVHIWVRGKIGAGARHDGVEVYSQDRFMVCTGDIIHDRPIIDAHDKINLFVADMRRRDVSVELDETGSEDLSDSEVFDKLCNAANKDKFNELCKGDWAGMGFPSQSEADLALLSMFCFYSQSNEQCRRLFRMTPLGKREKAVKNDKYINRTLKIIRGRQNREETVLAHGEQLAAGLLANMQVKAPHIQPAVAPQMSAGAAPIPPAAPEPVIADVEDEGVGEPNGELAWPPGLMGRLAYHIYSGAPRPVKEVGIIAALGLVAGIAGRVYQLPQSGLNVYLVLVARSAIGKEAMHSGLSKIVNELMMSCPTTMNHVSYNEFASGPALVKGIAENQCFVNVSGEWGHKLKRLSLEDGRDGPMRQLRTVMTNLYQKSAFDSIVGGLGYSDKEKSIASVSGVAYSMIGETTPGTFYDSLTESMMEDGFMSRFTIIEYSGMRPPPNDAPPQFLPSDVKQSLQQLIMYAGGHNPIYINRTDDAANIMHAFNTECDTHINGTTDEAWRQMWNRAHLKVLRIAGLCAVIDNNQFPTISVEHVNWALDLIRRDIAMMARRIAGGDVGMGDAPRERKLLACCKDFMMNGAPASYKLPDAMRKDGIISRGFFQIRIQRVTSFTAHRNGANFALDSAIKSLMDSGYLMEMSKDKMVEKYGFHGRAFKILINPHMPYK